MPVEAAVWTDVRRFYEHRDGAPAWVHDGNISTTVLKILRTAHAHGFAPEYYDEPQLTERLATFQQSTSVGARPDATTVRLQAPDRLQQMAEFDVNRQPRFSPVRPRCGRPYIARRARSSLEGP
jgi:hypothetical protein